MTYLEFKSRIFDALSGDSGGLTWKQLREQQELPYKRPCPEWTRRLQKEIGLKRDRKKGRELLWRI